MEEYIHFFFEDVKKNFTLEEDKVRDWLDKVSEDHDYEIENLNYIFCSDEYLLDINKTYLKHNFYTDIITFDQSEEENVIEGDIFISTERVKDNALTADEIYDNEMIRVIVHGILHLMGYKDKSKEEQEEMRKKEDEYISLYNSEYK